MYLPTDDHALVYWPEEDCENVVPLTNIVSQLRRHANDLEILNSTKPCTIDCDSYLIFYSYYIHILLLKKGFVLRTYS